METLQRQYDAALAALTRDQLIAFAEEQLTTIERCGAPDLVAFSKKHLAAAIAAGTREAAHAVADGFSATAAGVRCGVDPSYDSRRTWREALDELRAPMRNQVIT